MDCDKRDKSNKQFLSKKSLESDLVGTVLLWVSKPGE